MRAEVLIEEIGRHRQIVIGVGRSRKRAGGLGPQRVLAHQARHTVLSDPPPLVTERPGDAWRAGAPLVVVGDAPYGLNKTLIGLRARSGGTVPPLVVTAARNGPQATHKGDRMLPFVASDQGVLHFD